MWTSNAALLRARPSCRRLGASSAPRRRAYPLPLSRRLPQSSPAVSSCARLADRVAAPPAAYAPRFPGHDQPARPQRPITSPTAPRRQLPSRVGSSPPAGGACGQQVAFAVDRAVGAGPGPYQQHLQPTRRRVAGRARPAQLPLTTAAAAAAARLPPCRPLPLPRPAGRRGTTAMAGPGSYTNGPTPREAEVAPAPKRIKVNSGTWQHFVGPSYAVSGMLLTDHRMTVPLDHSGAS